MRVELATDLYLSVWRLGHIQIADQSFFNFDTRIANNWQEEDCAAATLQLGQLQYTSHQVVLNSNEPG